MYHYIIDQSHLPIKNFDKLLGEVYGFLTEYQISGEVHRVTRLRNVPELVETALMAHARTIIAIGDDQTFLQLVEILAEQPEIAIGYIPLVPNTEIARILGLGGLADCCKAISQRRVDEFDLGLVGRTHFFTKIEFGFLSQVREAASQGGLFAGFSLGRKIAALSALPLTVHVDNKYTLTTHVVAGELVNTRPDDQDSSLVRSCDNKLDLVLLPKLPKNELNKNRQLLLGDRLEMVSGATVIHGKKFVFDGPANMNLIVNSLPIAKNSFTATISPHKLKVIVGKGRKS